MMSLRNLLLAMFCLPSLGFLAWTLFMPSQDFIPNEGLGSVEPAADESIILTSEASVPPNLLTSSADTNPSKQPQNKVMEEWRQAQQDLKSRLDQFPNLPFDSPWFLPTLKLLIESEDPDHLELILARLNDDNEAPTARRLLAGSLSLWKAPNAAVAETLLDLLDHPIIGQDAQKSFDTLAQRWPITHPELAAKIQEQLEELEKTYQW